jgi:hypothetical protein
VPKAGKESRIVSRLPSIGSLWLGRAPEPQVEVASVLDLGLIPLPKVCTSVLDGYNPESPDDPRGVGRVSLDREPLISMLNITLSLCLDLVSPLFVVSV